MSGTIGVCARCANLPTATWYHRFERKMGHSKLDLEHISHLKKAGMSVKPTPSNTDFQNFASKSQDFILVLFCPNTNVHFNAFDAKVYGEKHFNNCTVLYGLHHYS